MPFKANAGRRHHIPKQRFKVTNWRDYDASLRQRGSLTVWVTEEAIAAWTAEPRTTRGGQRTYGGSFGLLDNLQGPLVDDVTAIPAVRHAFDLLIAEHANPGIGTSALTEALMKQCLVLLVRNHLRQAGPASPFVGQMADPRLAPTVARVLRQPGAPTSLASMAADAGMSRSAFAAAFKAAFGQAPIEFVLKTRLHHAARVMATTELPVKVVAASMGFSSRSHFSRAFRAAYGQDPSAYRSARLHDGAEPPGSDGRGWLDRLADPDPDEVV